MISPRYPLHLVPVAVLLLGLGCDSTGPTRDRTTYGLLFANTTFQDSATGNQSMCLLSGGWRLPAWPAATQTDMVSLHLARQLTTTSAGTVFRDTLLTPIVLTWVRLDSTHLSLQFGSPLNTSLQGALDSANGNVLRATWSCPATLPLATDSALVANGYQADSLPVGGLTIGRVIPVD